MEIDFDKLREWVRAEINAAFESRELGADGYTGGSDADHITADNLFIKLKESTKGETR